METGKILKDQHARQVNEQNYWWDKLSGEWEKSTFPYDHPQKSSARVLTNARFCMAGESYSALMKLSNQSHHRLYMILQAQLLVLLYKYTARTDIILGMPIYKQEKKGKFINTVLAIRNTFNREITFKELLFQVRQAVIETVKHQNHPMESLKQELKRTRPGDDFPLFDIAILLENIHDQDYIKSIKTDMLFSFRDTGETVESQVGYDAARYTASTVEGIITCYQRLVRHMMETAGQPLGEIQILGQEEKNQLLYDFNDTAAQYETQKPLQQLFEEQEERTPDRIALYAMRSAITYKELNWKSNQLAHWLRGKGVKPDTIVGVLMESSIERIVTILAILKAGGAYLPLDPEIPENRVLSILKDCRISILLTNITDPRKYSYTRQKNLYSFKVEPCKTRVRPQITDFDAIPYPDRGLVDYGKYRSCMGHAVAAGSVSIQATRGCPYNCAYCHKIWPRKHIFRTAENLFTEVQHYYRQGVRSFSFVDDIFNLKEENSRKFYRLIIDNRMRDIRLFFPNGLRGDILTRDYIDLMVEAGVKSIALALETGSPRLQQLIGKRLDLEKFHDNIEYITQKYPQIFLELFTMLGFPTETEEEAMMTYNFIKSIKWIHFPFVFILKIFPNTDMAKLAIENGIPAEAITRSANLAFHQLPETLPFPRSFVLRYQARFTNEYFMSKERLLHVLPHQMKLCTENELVQKYQNSLPITVKHFPDILHFFGISPAELQNNQPLKENSQEIPAFYKNKPNRPPDERTGNEPFRILLLDLSLAFTSEQEIMLRHQVIEPLGLMYLMTYLNKKFGNRVTGSVLKSRIDFDSQEELKEILQRNQPDLIGIRTLSYYKEFFHRIVSYIRHQGVTVPIVSGGPYATSDYKFILQDPHVDLVVLGEGEITFAELVEKIMENQKQLPDDHILKSINGIAFVEKKDKALLMRETREVIYPDRLSGKLARCPGQNPAKINRPQDLLYLIATSGSTGKPKNVMLEHRNLANLLYYQNNHTNIEFRQGVLQFTSIGFDVSAQEIFSTLLAGGELHLIDSEMKTDVHRLFDRIEKNDIRILFLPPAFLKLVFSRPEYTARFPKTVKHIIAAGEQLVVPTPLQNLLKQNRVTLHNHYGPTETHVVTTLTMDPTKEIPVLPSIGKPIANTRIYILDHDLNLLPIGVTGQLYIGGANVGRGYLNNPKQTLEKFCHLRPGAPVPPGSPRKNFSLEGTRGLAPLSDRKAPGKFTMPLATHHSPLTLYRTGDLARWLPDGTIEFRGRKDYQVKIRGYRIELEEIQKHLQEIDFIKDAVVIERETQKGNPEADRYLCAYFISQKKEEVTRIRDILLRSLPGYMIPAYFVQLEAIPLTINGKVNRKLLPDPVVRSGQTYDAPRDAVEQKLAEIWSEILEIKKDHIGIEANFFEMGGQSLKATVLISEMQRAFEIKTNLEEIFRQPTIRGLAALVKRSKREVFESIKPGEKREYYPLSSAQQRMYIRQHMTADNMNYNLSMFVILEGEIEKGKLEQVFKQLIIRHEAMRTSFQVIAREEEAVQRVHDETLVNHWTMDFAELEPGEIDREIKEFVKPFDLTCAPLLRVGLKKLQHPTAPQQRRNKQAKEDRYLLMVDMHHIITDAASLAIITAEFFKLYSGEELPPLQHRYMDFTLWQNRLKRTGEIKKQEQYWINQYVDNIPVLNLPGDFVRPGTPGFAGQRNTFQIDTPMTLETRRLISGTATTLFIVMTTVFNILFHKYTEAEDIVVGMVAEGRPHADLRHIIGMFVNTLAIRNQPAGHKTFREFLNEVKKSITKAHENQDYPFEELVRKLGQEGQTNRNPLFDVIFPYAARETTADETPGMKLTPYENNNNLRTRFDLSISARESKDTIEISTIFSTELFKSTTIESMARRFKLILRQVVAKIEVKIADIDILTEEEKRTLIFEFNNAPREYASHKTVDQLFEEQVTRVPDRIAVIGEEKQITYKEISQRASSWAGELAAGGIKSEGIVAIIEERTPAMIPRIMAVLKAGAAYMPLDPDAPKKRQETILEDSGAVILVTKTLERKNHLFSPTREVIIIDGMNVLLQQPSGQNHEPVIRPDDLAYVLYTSGTTGKPKGVMIRHRNINNLVKGLRQVIYREYGDGIRVAQVAPFVFDASVKQIFAALLQGHTLAIVPGETRIDSRKLLEFYEKNRIEISDGTPTHIKFMWECIKEQQKPAGKNYVFTVKHFIIGGEPLPVQTAAGIIEQNPGNSPKITNIYGVTECTVDSTSFEAAGENIHDYRKQDTLPIGRPLPNSFIYILNPENKLQPIEIPGEIGISGAGVGRGYLNNPGLTAEKFYLRRPGGALFKDKKFLLKIYNEKLLWGVQGGGFLEKSPPGRRRQKIYKTGDLAKWQQDGNIIFLGRKDNQVKIRGNRIELGEIENRLRSHGKIKDAVVVVKQDSSGEKYLCAYIVSDAPLQPGDLRRCLLDYLPVYMIPTHFVNLEKIPLNQRGKVNRQALPEPPGTIAQTGEYAAPGDELEEELVRLWSEMFHQEKTSLSIDANFFEIGGHSLKAAVLSARMHKALNIRITLTEMFTTPTIRELAALIRKKRQHANRNIYPDKHQPIPREEKKEYYPLSPAMIRLYFEQRMNPASIHYNMIMAAWMEGDLDRQRMEQAFRNLVQRHETLRTAFIIVNDEPVQKIQGKNCQLPIAYYTPSITDHEAPAGQVKKTDTSYRSYIEEILKPFDITKAPLFRVALIKASETRHLILVSVHHMAADGTSLGLIRKEFMALYRHEELPRLNIQYKDYTRWKNSPQHQELKKKQESFWKDQYKGGSPGLTLPYDYPRPPVKSGEGAVIYFTIPAEKTKKLRQMAIKEDVSLYMLILALINILLMKLSGQGDIVVGTPSAGRDHADLEPLVGMFVNTLALRNYPTDDKIFTVFLKEVKNRTLQAFSNQDYELEALVRQVVQERDPARSPIFDVFYALQNMEMPEVVIPGLSIRPYEIEKGTSRFDISLQVFETHHHLEVGVEYCVRLFEKKTIERFMENFQEIIAAVQENPDIYIKDIKISTEAREAKTKSPRIELGF